VSNTYDFEHPRPGVTYRERWALTVQCGSEAEQRALFDSLVAQGVTPERIRVLVF